MINRGQSYFPNIEDILVVHIFSNLMHDVPLSILFTSFC